MLRLQAGSPVPTAEPVSPRLSLGDTIEALFPLMTEDAVLIWHGRPILLGYRYDFGVIVDDWMNTIHLLAGRMSGVVTFPSNSFNARWDITINDDEVEILPRWDSVLGCPSQLPVKMRVEEMLAELLEPMRAIKAAVAGQPLLHAEQKRIDDLLRLTPRRGALYRLAVSG